MLVEGQLEGSAIGALVSTYINKRTYV